MPASASAGLGSLVGARHDAPSGPLSIVALLESETVLEISADRVYTRNSQFDSKRAKITMNRVSLLEG